MAGAKYESRGFLEQGCLGANSDLPTLQLLEMTEVT